MRVCIMRVVIFRCLTQTFSDLFFGDFSFSFKQIRKKPFKILCYFFGKNICRSKILPQSEKPFKIYQKHPETRHVHIHIYTRGIYWYSNMGKNGHFYHHKPYFMNKYIKDFCKKKWQDALASSLLFKNKNILVIINLRYMLHPL